MTEALQQTIDDRIQFLDERKLPAVLMPAGGESLQALVREGRDPLAAILRRHGAILFRGFGVSSAEEFREAAAMMFDNTLRTYVGGVSPRGEVMAGVYESTRFPAHLRIPQHSEMAYLPEPPRALAFYCQVEPQMGGETPLADTREIYRRIPDELRAAFEESGIAYHRYLYGPRWNIHHLTRNKLVKLHTSWMAAFATEDPAVIEKACAATGSTVRWDREEGAKISNVLPAFRRHPETGEMVWFNQVPTFLSAPKSTGFFRWLLYHIAYPDPFRRPFHATLGNGKPITLRQMNMVSDAIEAATVRFHWQRGDVLVVDNFLMTHGRMPFKGARKILVAIH